MKIGYATSTNSQRLLTNTNLRRKIVFPTSDIHWKPAQRHSNTISNFGNTSRWVGKDLQQRSNENTSQQRNVAEQAANLRLLLLTRLKKTKSDS